LSSNLKAVEVKPEGPTNKICSELQKGILNAIKWYSNKVTFWIFDKYLREHPFPLKHCSETYQQQKNVSSLPLQWVVVFEKRIQWRPVNEITFYVNIWLLWSELKGPFTQYYFENFINWCYNSVNVIKTARSESDHINCLSKKVIISSSPM